ARMQAAGNEGQVRISVDGLEIALVGRNIGPLLDSVVAIPGPLRKHRPQQPDVGLEAARTPRDPGAEALRQVPSRRVVRRVQPAAVAVEHRSMTADDLRAHVERIDAATRLEVQGNLYRHSEYLRMSDPAGKVGYKPTSRQVDGAREAPNPSA